MLLVQWHDHALDSGIRDTFQLNMRIFLMCPKVYANNSKWHREAQVKKENWKHFRNYFQQQNNRLKLKSQEYIQRYQSKTLWKAGYLTLGDALKEGLYLLAEVWIFISHGITLKAAFGISLVFYSRVSINVTLINVKSPYLLRKVYSQGCANLKS
jgi:hypothetical protein